MSKQQKYLRKLYESKSRVWSYGEFVQVVRTYWRYNGHCRNLSLHLLINHDLDKKMLLGHFSKTYPTRQYYKRIMKFWWNND